MPIIHTRNKSFLATLAAAAFAGSLALASPVLAHMAKGADPVETQIASLHDQLHITDQQAGQFDAFAKVMRDNRDAHTALVQTLRQNEKTMTALEDMQAYAKIAQAHAEAMTRLETAFEGLYASLSDDQKKAADELFRQHKRRSMHHPMGQMNAAPKAAN